VPPKEKFSLGRPKGKLLNDLLIEKVPFSARLHCANSCENSCENAFPGGGRVFPTGQKAG